MNTEQLSHGNDDFLMDLFSESVPDAAKVIDGYAIQVCFIREFVGLVLKLTYLFHHFNSKSFLERLLEFVKHYNVTDRERHYSVAET